MCLILFSLHQHPRYPLVLLANRDEYYSRPTAPATFWMDAEGLLAGRDLQAGGTWMGVTRSGRFAALTNYREVPGYIPGAPSRGALVVDFLRGAMSPAVYLNDLAEQAADYNGFNLLVGDRLGVYYASNKGAGPQPLSPGLYGLSNHLLDTPWPKVVRGKAALQQAVQADSLQPEGLITIMTDTTPGPDRALPDTGVGLIRERALSPMFIASPNYGTRLTTALVVDQAGHVSFIEHTYPLLGHPARTERFSFSIEEPVEDL